MASIKQHTGTQRKTLHTPDLTLVNRYSQQSSRRVIEIKRANICVFIWKAVQGKEHRLSNQTPSPSSSATPGKAPNLTQFCLPGNGRHCCPLMEAACSITCLSASYHACHIVVISYISCSPHLYIFYPLLQSKVCLVY